MLEIWRRLNEEMESRGLPPLLFGEFQEAWTHAIAHASRMARARAVRRALERLEDQTHA